MKLMEKVSSVSVTAQEDGPLPMTPWFPLGHDSFALALDLRFFSTWLLGAFPDLAGPLS